MRIEKMIRLKCKRDSKKHSYRHEKGVRTFFRTA